MLLNVLLRQCNPPAGQHQAKAATGLLQTETGKSWFCRPRQTSRFGRPH